MYSLSFNVYHANDKTGRVELEGNTIKKECYFPEDRYKYPFMYFPFYNINTSISAREYLSTRVIPRNRQNINELLAEAGLTEYNFYKMLELNHGRSYEDYIWFQFDHLPDDKYLTWEQLKEME